MVIFARSRDFNFVGRLCERRIKVVVPESVALCVCEEIHRWVLVCSIGRDGTLRIQVLFLILARGRVFVLVRLVLAVGHL